MSIVVTPIPRLIDLAAPAFLLGTASAAGSAATAVASDSTLLMFDTTLPAATGTAAVGSATTAPRRDHVHSSIVGESKLVQFARTASAGAGVQAITGVGFEPIAIYMIAIVHGTILYSFGFVDGDAADVCVFSTTGPLFEDVNNVIDINNGSPANNMWAPLTSLDSDGFTVTWSKQLTGQDVLIKALCWGP